jgi:hypothetical protein
MSFENLVSRHLPGLAEKEVLTHVHLLHKLFIITASFSLAGWLFNGAILGGFFSL